MTIRFERPEGENGCRHSHPTDDCQDSRQEAAWLKKTIPKLEWRAGSLIFLARHIFVYCGIHRFEGSSGDRCFMDFKVAANPHQEQFSRVECCVAEPSDQISVGRKALQLILGGEAASKSASVAPLCDAEAGGFLRVSSFGGFYRTLEPFCT